MRELCTGYIYRYPEAAVAILRDLLAGCTDGWAWDARTLVYGLTQVDTHLEQCMEGRAFGATRDIRWRRCNQAFDIVILTLSDQSPAGFVPLLPAPATSWRIMPTRYRWQVAPVPSSNDSDIDRPATAFLAPDGSIQFVALIDSVQGDSDAG